MFQEAGGESTVNTRPLWPDRRARHLRRRRCQCGDGPGRDGVGLHPLSHRPADSGDGSRRTTRKLGLWADVHPVPPWEWRKSGAKDVETRRPALVELEASPPGGVDAEKRSVNSSRPLQQRKIEEVVRRPRRNRQETERLATNGDLSGSRVQKLTSSLFGRPRKKGACRCLICLVCRIAFEHRRFQHRHA